MLQYPPATRAAQGQRAEDDEATVNHPKS